MAGRHIHFVTGRLAEPALRTLLGDLAPQAGFQYSVQVMPITVAALMTPQWVARHLVAPAAAVEVILPGYCEGDLSAIPTSDGVAVRRGPRDLRGLPEFFGAPESIARDFGAYDIQILAEINHAPRQTLPELISEARRLSEQGADLIDIGCDPGDTWRGVSDCVKALTAEGLAVSIDSFNVREVEAAVKAGAELVLSVNAANREAARQWGCEVVAIPDEPGSLHGLEETIECLSQSGVPFRIDPILEPIGCGFARSLQRYAQIRDRYPQAEMMMGIGNLTELTDCDSAAVNVLLLGYCQELGIRSVLTTQVINWARTSVRECDAARRLVYYAVRSGTPPKNLEPRLIMLRDAKLREHGQQHLQWLSQQIKDHNYRIFTEAETLHLISSELHLQGQDPYLLFQDLASRAPRNLSAEHAFYLGYEMAKAVTALTLGKEYRQDEALDWGLLTRQETTRRAQRPDVQDGGAEEEIGGESR